MKKRFLIPLIILGMGAVGTATGFSVNAYYQNKANEVAQQVEAQEEIANDENLTEEEKSKLQIVIDQLTAKYNEIKDIQVAGTTIGAIAGAVVGAIVSAIPALLNRSNIKKAIENVNITRNYVDETIKVAEEMKNEFDITNKSYGEVIKFLKETSAQLSKTDDMLKAVLESNDKLSAENAELKEILMGIVTNSKDLVASGIAEQLSKKYLSK